uniref:Photosystem II protein psb28 n=1 Tax=Nannochloropsis oculata TaxID=43925 RepID=T1RI27_9STRA|nr:photosystem II reaction center protein W [Nannochloropsis oculata]AGI99082.1 photosystem II reaction center protein W [Nannochloropsis oculata]AHX25373.1 photosystem II protein psb28 [Nannochloropsis oculata]
MTLKIKFEVHSNTLENLVPDFIRFTSSINEETSTITLNFYNPTQLFNLNLIINEEKSIKASLFLNSNWKYTTKDIRIIWVKGKPFILQAVFLLTSKTESKNLKIYLDKNNLLN